VLDDVRARLRSQPFQWNIRRISRKPAIFCHNAHKSPILAAFISPWKGFCFGKRRLARTKNFQRASRTSSVNPEQWNEASQIEGSVNIFWNFHQYQFASVVAFAGFLDIDQHTPAQRLERKSSSLISKARRKRPSSVILLKASANCGQYSCRHALLLSPDRNA